MENIDRINQYVQTIINGFKAINEIKYIISKDLVWLEKNFNNLSKLLEMKKSTPTFRHFLIEYLAKTYAQVIPVLRVGRYIEQQGISIWNLSDIPINKMEIVARSGVKWSDDVKFDLEVLGYNDLLLSYPPKKKRNNVINDLKHKYEKKKNSSTTKKKIRSSV